MPIDVSCPACNKTFEVDEQFAGRRGKCSKCGNVVVIPASRQESRAPTKAAPPATAPRSHSGRAPAPPKYSSPTPPTDSRIDMEAFERDGRRRRAARWLRFVYWGGGATGIAIISLVVARLVDKEMPTQQNHTAGLHAAESETASSAASAHDAPTFEQWKDVLSICHPDPDYILTDTDVYKCMQIYQSWKQIPTFAANGKRMFNIVAGCYFWNRDKTIEDWNSMFIQKWDPYWDDSPHCEIAENSRMNEIKRRKKNAKFVRKSTKKPPYTGASTRQEVSDICKNSTAKIDIEFEITVAVDYRRDLRGNLLSSDEVKEMMCEQVCDFVPGDPDRCCECESSIVDFVFHQKGWE